MPQSHTRQLLGMCRRNSVRGRQPILSDFLRLSKHWTKKITQNGFSLDGENFLVDRTVLTSILSSSHVAWIQGQYVEKELVSMIVDWLSRPCAYQELLMPHNPTMTQYPSTHLCISATIFLRLLLASTSSSLPLHSIAMLGCSSLCTHSRPRGVESLSGRHCPEISAENIKFYVYSK